MSIISITEPDLSQLTARQRRAWVTGDYSMVASRTDMVSERSDDADLRARWSMPAGDSGSSA